MSIDAAAEIEQAERAMAAGEYAAARDLARAAAASDAARAVDALLLEARACHALREYESAEACLERVLEREPERAEAHALRGRVLNNLRRLDLAEAALTRALELDPNVPEVHNDLGHVRRARGRAAEAETAFRQALGLRPDYPSAWFNLGTVLAATGQDGAARDSFERSLALDPGSVTARQHLASLLHRTGALSEAATQYERLLADAPDDLDARCNLASLRVAQGDVAGARQQYRSCLEREPGFGPALAGLAGILDLEDRVQEGLALLEPAIAAGAAGAGVHLAHAHLLRNAERPGRARAVLEALLEDRNLAAEHRSTALFLLAALQDSSGEHARAFASVEEANRGKAQPFDPERYRAWVERIVACFHDTACGSTSSEASERPVFIVGMPRSGTTLVEQVLASHPAVFGAGELGYIPIMARALGERFPDLGQYPEAAARLDRERSGALAREYLGYLHELDCEALRVTDKMWQNFEYLGFIHRLFPRARIVHCRRNPLDVGLSCYFQSFGAAGPPFASNLRHIGQVYNEYRRLMAFWRDSARVPMLEIDYEGMVNDLEGTARALLAHTGLDWHENCLTFHAHSRIVRTASDRQVRRPLYTSSVGRWRRYAAQLEPLRAILAAGPAAGELEP